MLKTLHFNIYQFQLENVNQNAIFLIIMDTKKVIILGASPNPARFSFMAANALADHLYDIIPVGLKQGTINGKSILDIGTRPIIDNIDTVTIYMNPQNQKAYQYDLDDFVRICSLYVRPSPR